MPQNLFRFSAAHHNLLIGARDEMEARAMLKDYLKQHPLLPAMINWRMKEICGSVSFGIFTLSGVVA